MKLHYWMCVVLLAVAVSSSRAEDVDSRLVGVWRLIASQTKFPDGRLANNQGERPSGLLIYDKSGYMSAHLMRTDLPRCGTSNRLKCPDAQARRAFDGYGGYWGRLQTTRAEGFMTILVQGASIPD